VAEAENPIAVPSFEDRVRYEGVWFRYDEEDVLKDVSIELKKGETVALVGPSGGGKSTLADLLPRYYDPVQGRITLDGKDLKDLKVADVRGLIGVVTQEGVLFNDSILHNIAYGDTTPDRARVEEAARIANAHEFIAQMPQGYDTNIGERGTKLSGGQRQRLAIARAIYKNAPILILDEATSALDSESERLVQQALDKLTVDRTSLVIAHRLSTIVNADRICVIDQGRVVESGTHTELLALKGVYHHLYSIQFQASLGG
ncbi:MAG: ATP-binding cassette domain-containing protein, partial [Bacteroidota bacterium]